MKKEYGIQDYFNLILKRKGIIAISAFSFLLAASIYTFTRPPVYVSSSVFMLESRDIGFGERGIMIIQQTRPLSYYSAVMRSRVFRNRTMRELLREDSAHSNINWDRRELSTLLSKNLSLTTGEYSDFIRLNAEANDPHLAFRVASVATEVLKVRCQEIDREESRNAIDFIENQKQAAKDSLIIADQSLEEFRENSDVALTSVDGGLMQELTKLEKKLTEIQTQKQLAQANLEAFKRRIDGMRIKVRGGSPQLPDTQSATVAQITNEISRLETQKEELIREFGNEFPFVVKRLDERIEEKRAVMYDALIQPSTEIDETIPAGEGRIFENVQQRKIAEELKVLTLENEERYYSQLIENFRKKHPRMMKQAVELMRLTRAKSVAENLYNFLLTRGEETKIQVATGTGGIRIIDHPVLPTEPVPINKVRNLLMGLLFGLGFGVGLAYFREYADNSINDQEDVTSFLGLPLMGIIPSLSPKSNFQKKLLSVFHNQKNNKQKGRQDHVNSNSFHQNLISNRQSKDPIVESYRSLRSNLQFADMDHPIRTMLISSPNPSDGKTITTANLGIVFALLGKNVIIVDTDLRKPKQHKVFNIDKSPGVTEYLVEDLPLEDIIHQTDIGNLKIIPCGKSPPNPAEILASQKMEALLREIERRADIVLCDSPPLAAVTDPMLLATRLDGIILVVKHRVTNKQIASNIVDQLKKANVNIIGVIMNQTLLTRGNGYYQYYSKYH